MESLAARSSICSCVASALLVLQLPCNPAIKRPRLRTPILCPLRLLHFLRWHEEALDAVCCEGYGEEPTTGLLQHSYCLAEDSLHARASASVEGVEETLLNGGIEGTVGEVQ